MSDNNSASNISSSSQDSDQFHPNETINEIRITDAERCESQEIITSYVSRASAKDDNNRSG